MKRILFVLATIGILAAGAITVSVPAAACTSDDGCKQTSSPP